MPDVHRSRVTVVGPTGRADLAVPRRVSAALILPPILDQLKIKAGAADAAWEIACLDGRPIDPGASLADCGVADGDLLFVRRIEDGPPERYDDVAEIIGEESAPVRWTSVHASITAGIAGAVLTLIAIAAVVAHLAPPARLLASAAAFAVLSTAVVAASRRPAMHGFASLLLVSAAACASIVGNAAAGGRLDGAGIVAGAAASGSCCLAGGLLIGRHAVVGYAGAGTAMFGAVAGVVVLTGGRLVLAAAIVGALAVVSLPLAPGIALRLSGVAALDRRDDGDVDPAVPIDAARARVRDADRALRGLLAGSSIGVASASVVLADSHDPTARGLAMALALLTLIRSRAFRDRDQAAVVTGAGLCALCFSAACLPWAGGLMPVAAFVVAAACFAAVFAIAARSRGFRIQRVIEVADVMLTCATLPVVLAIGGAYGAVLAMWD